MAESQTSLGLGNNAAPERTNTWEAHGKELLSNFVNVLQRPLDLLSHASDDYLIGYAGQTPGVETSLEARIKSTKNYQSAIRDPIIKHMMTAADTLTEKVEEKFAIIRALTPNTSHSGMRLGDAYNEAEMFLKQCADAKTREAFDTSVQQLVDRLQFEIDFVRNGATNGQKAAGDVAELSKTEQIAFDEWWNTNYKDGYRETIPDHQRALQAFAENAASKNHEYQAQTESALRLTPIDAVDPIRDFLATFRSEKFHTIKK